MDSVDVDGLRIAFTKAGRGRPVVLLGGFVGDGFVTWRRQIEALSTSYTVVAWDPPGSGASSDVPESFRLPDYADCLAGLVSALTPAEFVSLLLPSMFSTSAPADLVAEFGANMAERFRPAGFRTMALASAEADLRGVLPQIDVPTIVLHGEADVRAPKHVAEALCAAIPTARLVALPGVGHVSCVEAPERFTTEVQAFLRQV